MQCTTNWPYGPCLEREWTVDFETKLRHHTKPGIFWDSQEEFLRHCGATNLPGFSDNEIRQLNGGKLNKWEVVNVQ